MIADDLVYAGPDSLEGAFRAFAELAASAGPEAVRWLGGGTEIVTGARRSARPLRGLVDLKAIPEARFLGLADGRIRLGAALSLNAVGDSGLFPLLSATVRRIADRTTRNRLSLGGNLAGSLPWREAALPLLLAGAGVRSALPPGNGSAPVVRERPLAEVFAGSLALEPGELVLEFSFPEEAARLPWRHWRATRTGPVDYPLVTACFLAGAAGKGSLGAAFAGLLPHPVAFASTAEARKALSRPGAVRGDRRASAEYRLHLALDLIARAEEELP